MELRGDYYNRQDAIIVFQWRLTQSLFSSNSRLVGSLVGVSHTNDVTSHKCALYVLLKPVCRELWSWQEPKATCVTDTELCRNIRH